MNKVVLITGGARGIGSAIALELAKHGYDIVINYLTSKQPAKELKEKIESTEVKISVKVGKEGKLFGSVSTKQITDAIQAKLGEKIDKRKIALDGPINSLGTYEIPIQLHKDVIAKIKLFIVEE